MNRLPRILGIVALTAAILPSVAGQAVAHSTTVVIYEIYGGGGNSGSYWQNDYIVLHNMTGAPVDVSGWSVQYASSAGSTWARTNLVGSIPSGGYYLIQEARGAGGSTPLPTPEVTGTIAMSLTSGKVALRSNQTLLTCSTCGPSEMSGVVDFVGYGPASSSETAPTGSLSNTTAARRGGDGCTETDSNVADFSIVAPDPRNGSASPVICPGLDVAPSVTATSPTDGATDVALDASVDVTFSEPVHVAWDAFGLSCSVSGQHTSGGSGGPDTFSFLPDVAMQNGETCTATVYAAAVTDQDPSDPPDNMTADHTWTFTTESTHGTDLAIKAATASGWTGEGIVGPAGPEQIGLVTLRPRQTAVFDLKVTNTGYPGADDILITGPAGSRGFQVTYMHGPENATALVVGPGHICPGIPSLSSDQMTIKIKAPRNTAGRFKIVLEGRPDSGAAPLGDAVVAMVRVERNH